MKKVIEDNQVAVLYSPGFGAGWYSWHGVLEAVFDPVIVKMVLEERHHEIEKYCDETYGTDHYWGGAEDLRVDWVTVGARFRIEEYDGNERVYTEFEYKWLEA